MLLGRIIYLALRVGNGLLTRLLRKLRQIDVRFDYLEEHNLDRHRVRLLAGNLEPDPANLITTSRANFASKSGRAVFTAEVEGAVICPLSGRIYSSELYFLADCSPWSAERSLARYPLQPSTRKITFRDEVATFLPSQTFYHFLLEDLPAVMRSSALSKEAQIYVGPQFRTYLKPYLELAGLEHRTLMQHTRFRKVIFESRSPVFKPKALDVQTLRGLMSSQSVASITPAQNYSPLIYISRSKAGRTPTNEKEVQETLRSRGFTILELDGMAVTEQIACLAQATVIVGVHGAGLANMVWAYPGSCVIEIRKVSQPDCFKVLAGLSGHSYSSVESASSKWIVDIWQLVSDLESCSA